MNGGRFFYPVSISGCHECAYLQFQDAKNTGTALVESYLCRWLRTLGITHNIEFKRSGGAADVSSDEFQKIFEPHLKCPLRGEGNSGNEPG